MKNIILFLTIAVFAVSCKKKDKNTPTDGPRFFLFNGEISGQSNASAISSDGSVLICGGNMTAQNFVWKIGSDGSLIWKKEYPGTQELHGIVEAPDGNIYVSGKINAGDTFKNNFMLMKLDATGTWKWTKAYQVKGDEEAMNILYTKDGNLLLTGFTQVNPFDIDLRLMKVKLDGDTIWTRDVKKGEEQNIQQTIETADGGFLITGSDLVILTNHAALWKFGSDGAPLWAKKYTPESDGYSSAEMADGRIITCGSITINDDEQVLMQKTDANGVIEWTKNFGSPDLYEEADDMKKNADGSLVITGINLDFNLGVISAILMKTDAEGISQFSNKIVKTDYNYALNIHKDKNDDNILVGMLQEQIYTLRTDNQGKYK